MSENLSRGHLALTCLMQVPPLLRESLLDETGFREKYGIDIETMVDIGGQFSIEWSRLLDAIRSVLSGVDEIELRSSQGDVWLLSSDGERDEVPALILLCGNERLVLPHFGVLSNDKSIRLRVLENVVFDMNLPRESEEKWKAVLCERSLDDAEVDCFHGDVWDTPIGFERSISDHIRAGTSTPSSLVPHSERYFERLVGANNGSRTISEYARGPGRHVIERLAQWESHEGLLFSLLLSSHPALTQEIEVEHLSQEELIRAYKFLDRHGDPLSQLGAVEIGLRVLSERCELEPFLLRLINRLRDADALETHDAFTLFSSIFILVDGQLSLTGAMAKQPVFYRRLSALAHAALVHRQLVLHNIDPKRFSEWAVQICGQQFYMQSFADMRVEPRWCPDLADGPQMRNQFLGRILMAGQKFEQNLRPGELRDAILGSGEQSLNQLQQIQWFFPGPLVDGDADSNPLPGDIAVVIEERLSGESSAPSVFTPLINSARLFNMPTTYAEQASNILRSNNYILASIRDRRQLVAVLNGLAMVAAATRNSALADAVRILVRRYRRGPEVGLSIDEILIICLVCASAKEDMELWRDFVGDWLTELAFGELEGDEGERFHSHLKALTHSVPELWVSCGRADAALESWRHR